MDRVYLYIATGAGTGRLPWAPGTWGSLAGVILWLGLRWLPLFWYGGVVALLLVAGIVAAGAAEKILDRPDPTSVVIDEIVGQLIALASMGLYPSWILAGFLLFRCLDILKPGPVGWLDSHLHGGLGIMLDDVAAGFCTLLLLQGARLLLT